MKIITLNNYLKNNFKIKREDKKYKVLYKDDNFILEPKIAFNNCTLYTKNKLFKIKIKVDKENDEHQKFKDFIKFVYNNISEFIEIDENNIFISEVINPLNNEDLLFSIINPYTDIKDYDTKESLNIESLKDKSFILYPIFWAPNVNIYNEKVYINFILNSCCIKIIDSSLNKFEYNFKDVDEAINKYIK
jgi:hypothetical protein